MNTKRTLNMIFIITLAVLAPSVMWGALCYAGADERALENETANEIICIDPEGVVNITQLSPSLFTTIEPRTAINLDNSPKGEILVKAESTVLIVPELLKPVKTDDESGAVVEDTSRVLKSQGGPAATTTSGIQAPTITIGPERLWSYTHTIHYSPMRLYLTLYNAGIPKLASNGIGTTILINAPPIGGLLR